MAKMKGKCAGCGVPLEFDVVAPFAEAGVVGALCPGCRDCRFLDSGGAILELQRELEGARFPLESFSVASARGAQVFQHGYATSCSSLGKTL
jgi:hypothetical protein